ncbi:MAG: hypothetical protein AB1861_31505 [Cyanobacteriota bacterium]
MRYFLVEKQFCNYHFTVCLQQRPLVPLQRLVSGGLGEQPNHRGIRRAHPQALAIAIVNVALKE